ncbi:MAG: TolC family protein [Endomicrobium sp.]|nr:TolC family protein [Endomicrobium sp.]
MRKYILCCLIFFNFSLLYAKEIIVLTLQQCEKSALENSPTVKSLNYQLEAATKNLKAQKTFFYPSLTLDASCGYTAVIPTLSVMEFKQKLGNEWNYSAGPTVSYSLFDNGIRKSNYESIKNLCESKQEDLKWEKKNLVFNVRLQYFKIQSDLEKIYFLGQRLKLVLKQYKDISVGYKFGSKGELDLLMAERQVLSTRNQIISARSNVAKSLRTLFELTIDNFNIDPSFPTDYRLAGEKYITHATAVLKFDDIDISLNKFLQYESYNFDEKNPQVISLEKMQKHYENISESYNSQKWPLITFKAGGYYQYPNGPVMEGILQRNVILNFSMPLFETGGKKALSKAQEFAAQSVLAQKAQLLALLKTNFYNAKDRLSSIKRSEDLYIQMIKNNQKLAELTYISYKFGHTAFLEVQTSNFDLLQSQIYFVDLKIEKLALLVVLANLGVI